MDERFEEIDKEINLKFAELREHLQTPAGSRIKGSSSSALNEAERCLEEVDRHVNLLRLLLTIKINIMEDLLKDMPSIQRTKYVRRIQTQKVERNKLSRRLVYPVSKVTSS
jgi:vesicle transport through interaction with t-SNAREs 1